MSSSHAEPEQQSSATLNQIDVHLAIEVFQDARDKLCFLEEIAPDLDQHKDELTLYVGQEIERIIEEEESLETDFGGAVLARDELAAAAHRRSEIAVADASVRQLAEQIRESTKELCRNLRENPTVTENLVKTQQHRAELLAWLRGALAELQGRQAYAGLEEEISQRWMVYEEEEKLQEKEREARERAELLEEEIYNSKKEHQEGAEARARELAALREALLHQKQRAEDSIKLFQFELGAARDEAARERAAELIIQQNRLNAMLEAAGDEEAAQAVLFEAINRRYAEISSLAARTQQNCDGVLSVLATQKQLLEQERQEKAKKIEELEAQDAANKQEKAAWEEEQAFLGRMKAATQKTREMRAEVVRGYVVEKMVESLDPPMVKARRGKKGKK